MGVEVSRAIGALLQLVEILACIKSALLSLRCTVIFSLKVLIVFGDNLIHGAVLFFFFYSLK